MFESLSAKGPKLVYTHSRQGGPSDIKLGEQISSTTITSGPASSNPPQSHAIPRPSVTVVAQTRKPSNEEASVLVSREGKLSSSSADSSAISSINRTSAGDGMHVAEKQLPIKHYQQPDPEVYENYRSDPEPQTTKANNRGIAIPLSINIERVSNLDDNNNTNNSSSASVKSDSFNTNGYHGGYRVYRGKVYEITREIPIILTDGNNVPLRSAPSPSTSSTASSSNGKTTHSSTATASVIKVAPAMNGQLPNTHTSGSDIGQLQPRALPSPKLNGKSAHGVLQSNVPKSIELNTKHGQDHLQPQQHQQPLLFRENRKQQDDSRFSDGPELITYISGTQSMRRPNTVNGRKGIRELSPHTWVVRGRTGSASSPIPSGATRKLSPQRSASMTRTLPFRETGGQIWTVVTKSPPQSPSPRQRSSSTTGQQVVTRASYRLDPNISAKLQGTSTMSNQQPKSILKTNCSSPSATAHAVNSGKPEQYDNHPFPSDHPSTTGPSNLMPRQRATLAYRDFDFSSLPHQHSHINLVKSPKRNLQQTYNIPIHHHKSKAQPAHTATLSRRPATAGAALQKNGEEGNKGSQPPKKSVTFNSQVRLHVDNNVSTIRSLSIDS